MRLAALLVVCGCVQPPADAIGTVELPEWQDVTRELNLPATGSLCLVFRDFDRDGRPDLVLAPDGIAVYRNTATGFERHDVATDGGGPCAAGDLDGDGRDDVVWARGDTVMLARNVDGFTFAPPQVLPNAGSRLNALGLFDYDEDGRLDIVLGYVSTMGLDQVKLDCAPAANCAFECHIPLAIPPPSPLAVLHNLGGGQFEYVALPLPAGMANALQFVDWDGDGHIDILETDDFGPNHLRRNLGGGQFVDALRAAPYNHGMGAVAGDFNHDGRWDLYIAEVGPDEVWFGEANHNAGVICDATRDHSGWGPSGDDFNNDSWIDIAVPNNALAVDDASLAAAYGGTPAGAMFHDVADFVFLGRTGPFVLQKLAPRGHYQVLGRVASATADIDGDGRVDLAIVEEGGEIRLLHNVGPTAHWLGVRVESAATVQIFDELGELDRRAAGFGGIGVSSEVLHFGLGYRKSIQRIRVTWAGGQVQEMEGVAADQVVTFQR